VSRIGYLDGVFAPLNETRVRAEDRGFLFADAVYEVWAVRGGRLLDCEGHLQRLWRSMGELEIAAPMPQAALLRVIEEVRRRNRVRDGLVYLQVTRGAAPRDFPFPSPAVKPTLFLFARAADMAKNEARARAGVRVSAQPDIRWGRCDIKSTSLLANVLAKEAARRAGGFEALLLDGAGFVTEGASSSAWIVTRSGVLATRDLRANILPGVTRAALIPIARQLGLRLEERAFSLEEAKAAAELFLTSASVGALPVVAVDDAVIGAGTPGPVATALRRAYFSPSV
jgi:D-alanine transaminase